MEHLLHARRGGACKRSFSGSAATFLVSASMATSMKGYGLPPKLVHGLQAVVASLRPVLVHPEAVQKRLHLPSGDAGVAHLGLLQRLRYAAETGAGRMRGLRSVSFQLPCEEDVLQSAFEDKPLCVPRQLAELLQLSVDAMLRHDWRRLGISAEEARVCVWCNAPMRVLSSQGDLVGSYDPALKEHRAVCFLAFDGHYQQPGAVLRAEAEAGHQDPRAVGGARGAAEVVRGAGTGVPGPAPGRLGARDFFEAAEGEAGSARRVADGKCALRGCGLTAGTCELDHVVPVRQAFAGSAQILQALCGDCHSEKTLRESAQPTSLESRVAPGVMEYARSPKLPPLVFEAQTCAKDSTYVGVDVVRCNGLFPLPILCPADGVEPVDLGFVEGCCARRRTCPRRTAPRRGRRRPTTGCAGTWWWRRSRSWTWRCGLRGAERRREVPAAERLPAVAGCAGLLGRAAHQRAVGAQPTHPRPGRRAQARAHGEHALRPRHLQLREVAAGRRGGVPHAGAGQGEAEGALPLQARVAGHHAGHQPQQAHGRERSGEPRPGAGGL